MAGVEARDVLQGNTLTIRAKCVLNAAGPWAEQLLCDRPARAAGPKHVKTEWENVGTAPRAICSVYGEPNTAPVTYVGGVIRD